MQSFVSKALAATFLALAITTTAYAQPPVDQDPIAGIHDDTFLEDEGEELVVHFLPEGRRCEVDGEIFQCYSLSEYRVLLQMDNDLFHYQLQLENAQEAVERLERINTQLTIAMDGYESQIDTLQTERTRLFEQWQEENRLRLEAENRPNIGSWVAWGLSALEAAVIMGLVIALAAGAGG